MTGPTLTDGQVDAALWRAVAFYQFSDGDNRYSEESMRDAYRAGLQAGNELMTGVNSAADTRPPELSMPVEDIARVCHAANRAMQMLTGDPSPSPSWSEAPEWQQLSEIHGVECALQGATPEDLHRDWSEHRIAAGWTLGPVKDPDAKTHPCLVPYAELPASQRAKDAVFKAVVDALR